MAEDSPPLRFQVVDKLAALATAAFGLVAALAWNSAVQATFQMWFPGERGVLAGQYGYAMLVTVVAVGVAVWLGRAAGRVKESLEPGARG